MKVKCDYCGSFIEDTDETCPNCGAVNSHLMRSADGVPKTIEELKAFAKAKNLPLEEMRFFIGIDYKEPKRLAYTRILTVTSLYTKIKATVPVQSVIEAKTKPTR